MRPNQRKQKIAVAIIHGMGRQKEDFAAELKVRLDESVAGCFKKRGMKPRTDDFVILPIYWAHIADRIQDELEIRLELDVLAWKRLRSFVIGYLGDAIAYQMPLARNQFLVDSIHLEMKNKLAKLAATCGDCAPLCIISHSLGTVISSEYFKSVQQARASTGASPLASGRTLALYYTMGSPLPIWALREKDFGFPPDIPSPGLQRMYPNLVGEWINFYSKYDVLGFPLRPINDRYRRRVNVDRQIDVGRLFSRYTPLAHHYYWENKTVVRRMAEGLVRAWIAINGAR
ncbi:chemotaxis protein [Xylanibacillus composti]|uniref:Chemotaxis protein n=1 Tax=Xylanibacillus composti TaxID=1572762 RepID=A0A8J4H6P9_9BACL|nr:chemotaxis protein [Xylanibacillus composti]MDT9726264.1 chemotaxis protein [Xylanibacillus composti]GIQ70707.1 hypothetical protein XYCOK13_35310 [Xylanibacillus composti]